MTHAWCSDPSRDAAVRAAEDGRTGPLPTLGEAITRPFACAACGGAGMDHRCKESCEECDGSGRAMIPKSGSSSSAPEQENKGVRMTKSDRQAADYRAEAIASPFAEAAQRSVEVSEMGGTQSGIRTERVTLECVHRFGKPPREWDWWRLMELRPGESVRVVIDDPSSDADAEVLRRALVKSDIQRLKADAEVQRLRKELEARNVTPGEGSCDAQTASGNSQASPDGSQAARGGGEGEPVAWARLRATANHEEFFWCDIEETYGAPEDAELDLKDRETVVPVYRQPPQPRGWLTQGERSAIEDAIGPLRESGKYACENRADLLQNLLARSSPPEVG